MLDSEVFVLVLSNSVLSRSFCKKELGWAIEFGKPIICIQMQDDRFWPWDYGRWKTDMCTKEQGSWPLKWKCGWLQSTYDQNETSKQEKQEALGLLLADPTAQRSQVDELKKELQAVQLVCERDARIKTLIEHHCAQGKLIPFRRRGFENDAMVREILRRAGTDSTNGIGSVRPCVWGQHIPPSLALKEANAGGTRRVYVVWSEATGGALMRQLKQSLEHFSTGAIRFGGRPGEMLGKKHTRAMAKATHVLVLLTKGVVDDGSASLSQIRHAIESRAAVSVGKTLLYIYLKQTAEQPGGWSFETMKPPKDVQQSLWNNEAMEYRLNPLARETALGAAASPGAEAKREPPRPMRQARQPRLGRKRKSSGPIAANAVPPPPAWSPEVEEEASRRGSGMPTPPPPPTRHRSGGAGHEMAYEHASMCLELLRRMKVEAALPEADGRGDSAAPAAPRGAAPADGPDGGHDGMPLLSPTRRQGTRPALGKLLGRLGPSRRGRSARPEEKEEGRRPLLPTRGPRSRAL